MKKSKMIPVIPASDPDKNRLWRNIESGIVIDGLYNEINRVSLENAIQNLTQISPDREIWTKLQLQIDIKAGESNHQKKLTTLVRIAATILILISSVLIMRFLLPINKLPDSSQQPVELFLTQLCSKHPAKCKEEDFIELKSEIIRLSNEKSEVESSIFYNPEDASIAKVNNRISSQIESLKTQILDYVN